MLEIKECKLCTVDVNGSLVNNLNLWSLLGSTDEELVALLLVFISPMGISNCLASTLSYNKTRSFLFYSIFGMLFVKIL
jgi:hypothetical protein